MIRVTLLILLLLPVSGWAVGEVHIFDADSCGKTLGSAYENDTIRISGTKMSCSGTGVTFDTDSIFFDFDGDTLEYCTGGSNDKHGISSSGLTKGVVITGGFVLFAGDSTTYGARGVWGDGTSGWLIEDMTITAGGFEATAVKFSQSNYGEHDNAHIKNCRLFANSNGFTDREDPGVMGVSFDWAYSEVEWPEYNIWIESTYIYSTYQAVGSKRFDVSNPGTNYIINGCTLVVDARNDLYSYPSSNEFQSTANAVAIGGDYIGAGSQIYDNVILSDSSFAGCDIGIGLQFTQGTSTDSIHVYNNTIDIFRGLDAWYGDLNTKGVKFRGGNKYVYFHDNYVRVSADSNSTTTYRGPTCFAMDWLFMSYDGEPPDSFITIENNVFVAVDVDGGSIYSEDGGVDSSAGTGCACYRLESDEVDGGYHMESNSIIRGNRDSSDHVIFSISTAEYDGSAYNFWIQNDTVCKGSNVRSDFAVYQYGWGSKGGGGIGSRFIDTDYENGASADDSEWVDGTPNATQADYRLAQTLILFVDSGGAYEGASVSVINDYGDTVIQATTDAQGLALDPDTVGSATVYRVYNNVVITRFASQEETDSTDYFPFIAFAAINGDTIWDTLSSWEVGYVDTLMFGEGEPPTPQTVKIQRAYLKGVRR